MSIQIKPLMPRHVQLPEGSGVGLEIALLLPSSQLVLQSCTLMSLTAPGQTASKCTGRNKPPSILTWLWGLPQSSGSGLEVALLLPSSQLVLQSCTLWGFIATEAHVPHPQNNCPKGQIPAAVCLPCQPCCPALGQVNTS